MHIHFYHQSFCMVLLMVPIPFANINTHTYINTYCNWLMCWAFYFTHRFLSLLWMILFLNWPIWPTGFKVVQTRNLYDFVWPALCFSTEHTRYICLSRLLNTQGIVMVIYICLFGKGGHSLSKRLIFKQPSPFAGTENSQINGMISELTFG